MLRCPMTIESLSHQIAVGDVLGKLDVHWGRNSFSENLLKAKVKYAKSVSDMILYETLHETRLRPKTTPSFANVQFYNVK